MGVRLVPKWFQKEKYSVQLGASGHALKPFLGLALLLASFFWSQGLLSVLVDWVGFAVDEGFSTYAAQRVREGDILYKDFFFLWTPGIVFVHAAMQELGLSDLWARAASAFFASLGGALTLALAGGWLKSNLARVGMAVLLFLWGFSLWNIPYSSWYALSFSLLGYWLFHRQKNLRAGLLFALAFWFKQNMGILSFLGLCAGALLSGRRLSPRLLLTFLLGVILPFSFFFLWGGSDAFLKAFSQIFLFPFEYRVKMAEGIPTLVWGAPLFSLGLWILSLYLFQQANKWAALGALGVIAYSFFTFGRIGLGFFSGWFFLGAFFGWGLAAILLLEKSIDKPWSEELKALLFFYCFSLGLFLQVYPRMDFQHFLFVFPLSAFWMVWSIQTLKEKYKFLPVPWICFPLLILAMGGGISQYRVLFVAGAGLKDAAGFTSFGQGHLLNEEMKSVKDFLLEQGLKRGDPVLVVPNATVFYRFSGFKNVTAHDQFFPSYVTAFGEREEDVLENFEAKGGRYVVYQERSKTETFSPLLQLELEKRYERIKTFPIHFSVMRKRGH